MISRFVSIGGEFYCDFDFENLRLDGPIKK